MSNGQGLVETGPDTLGEDALDLLARWRAHGNDECASLNTLFAVFGVTSPLGRFADRFCNYAAYAMWLKDIACDYGKADKIPRDAELNWRSLIRPSQARALATISFGSSRKPTAARPHFYYRASIDGR